MKKKAIISACLIGENCKYSGGNNKLPEQKLKKIQEKYELYPVCPEVLGGLPTPRVPSERVGDRVLAKDGRDVTAQFQKGAQAAYELAKSIGAELAVLKENSPSCGHGTVYDGTFSGTLISGDGVTAEKLKEIEIKIIGESEI